MITRRSISRVNSRPMTAATWANALASPSRSSRASSELCKVDGIDHTVGSSVAACVFSSSTIWLSSSRNNGLPPARSTMRSRTSPSTAERSSNAFTSSVASPSDMRSRLTWWTWSRDVHAGTNSGRDVVTSRTRSVTIRSTTRPKSSRLEGSHQCRSSTSNTTGS